MFRYNLLLMTPTDNKYFYLLADEYYIQDGCFIFSDLDRNKIAVYPIDRLAIQSIEKNEY